MALSEKLKREVVHEHSRRPRNYGELETPTHVCVGHNPNCSDSIKLTLKVSMENRIEAMGFRATGSALSKASASLMSEAVLHRTVEEALELFELFHQLTLGAPVLKPWPEAFQKLQIFSGIAQHPSRVKCATLPWHALKGALENRDSTVLGVEIPAGSPDGNLTSTVRPEERETSGMNLDGPDFQLNPTDTLDLKGVKCPINFVRTKVRMAKMAVGEQLRVVLDAGDPIRNVPRSLKMEGHRILFEEVLPGGEQHAIVVEKAGH